MLQQHLAPLIDSHIHTDDPRLDIYRDTMLKKARELNIKAQIVPSISRQHWLRVKNLCDMHPDLFACYGLHPCFQQEHRITHLEELADWIGRERPVAVGECGLDYHIGENHRMQQQQLFAAQLALAREFNLPIVVHARKAVEDVIRMIRTAGHFKGVVHSFNGSQQQAHRLLDLGYKLGFGGAVTYARAKRLRTMLKALPLDSILIETDAPDQTDASHQGQVNQPAFLVAILQSIADLRSECPEKLAAHTTRNAIELFALDAKSLQHLFLPI